MDAETLGGATMHCEVSGVTDNKYPDDASCLMAIRRLVDKIGTNPSAGFNRSEARDPLSAPEEIFKLFPLDRMKPYDTESLLASIVDAPGIEAYKPDYGKSLVCAYARIDGWSVGIVANQRKIIKTGKGEMQMGGVIYGDAADKAARFIMNCNQKKIPLIFFQDVTGFMVGSRAEQGGIIKDGAKMVNAMANSVVPKFTFIIGNSYGAGNYAMCGKAYDPRLIFAWPSARMAVMSAASAAKTLMQIEKAALNARGQEIDEAAESEISARIADRYNRQQSPYHAASRLWVDGVINPMDTRMVISTGISIADQAPIEKPFNVGVLQV